MKLSELRQLIREVYEEEAYFCVYDTVGRKLGEIPVEPEYHRDPEVIMRRYNAKHAELRNIEGRPAWVVEPREDSIHES